VNIQSLSFRLDPFPTYSAMRKQAGVCKVDPAGLWAVVRYDEVARVLREHSVFSSAALNLSRRPWLSPDPFAVSLAAMDPPAHTSLRRLGVATTQLITTPSVEALVRRCAEPLTARLSEGACDFIAGFAAPLLAQVMSTLLGARSLAPRIIAWVEALSAGVLIPAERIPSLLSTFAEMEGELLALLEARLRNPGDDLVSGLIAAGMDRRPPEASDALGLIGLILVAAFETTVQLLANIVLTWARHPAAFERARSAPSLVPRLVEEVLRIEPPVHAIDRTTAVDVKLGEVEIPAGSLVLAFVASANRDERRFTDPDQFNPDRDRVSTLSFGHGVHSCLGGPIARTLARTALSVLLQRFRSVELTAAPLEWQWTLSLRTLPVLHATMVS
jgi:cytochrome P450